MLFILMLVLYYVISVVMPDHGMAVLLYFSKSQITSYFSALTLYNVLTDQSVAIIRSYHLYTDLRRFLWTN